MSTIFNDLPPALVTALEDAFNITTPMPVQTASFPLISEGRNLVLQSRTGSGKTLAYLLPLLTKLTPGESGNRVLIVAPTQELAVQIGHVVRDLNAMLDTPYSLALIGGGANINHQLEKLKTKPQLLVGTPGRILELFDRRKINGQTIEAVVFDEVDALLDQESGRQLAAIQKALRKSTQTIACSASIDDAARQWLSAHIENAEFLVSDSEAALNPNIGHYFLRCEARKKFDNLRKALAAMDGKTLIFLNGDDDIAHLQDRLAYHHIEAGVLSAEMKKLERQKALETFRQGFDGILIASDLAARGLDIPDIDQVINLDFPLEPLTYVHRAGRTGRGNADGATLSFVSDSDEAAIRIYQRDLGIQFEEVHFAEGMIVAGPAPEKPKKKKPHATAPAPKPKQKDRARKAKAKGAPKNHKGKAHRAQTKEKRGGQ